MSTLSARRPLLVVAVLAMVATMLFAINAGTASAATPNAEAVFTACPDNAGIPANGFSDTAGSLYDGSVDCLKYYGITEGTTASTYSPAQDVTRVQMALFLARFAYSAGVSLSATPPSAGFTDIGGLSVEAQWAINALADAGITKGTSATTFSPAAPVMRNQMALFLTRFLGKAHIGPGGSPLGSANTTGAPFSDIASQTFESWTAIQQSWNLGITTGNTATTYNPAGHVTRGQMALFITRTAAHANTRPAGVNLQVVPATGFGPFAVDVSATARNADFSPLPNVDIDMFGTIKADPFTAAGTCIPGDVGPFGPFLGTPCLLEVADPSVDIFGNLSVFGDNAFAGKTGTGYAWTGAPGAMFNKNTTAYSKVTVTSAEEEVDIKVTNDVSTHAQVFAQGGGIGAGPFVKYGTTANYTIQLIDTNGDPVLRSGVSMNVKQCLQVGSMIVGFPAATCTDTVMTTNAAGVINFTATAVDPAVGTGNAQAMYHRIYNAPGGDEFDALNWRDWSGANSVELALPAYKLVNAVAPTPNTVSATVWDWFGKTAPAGVDVKFTSDQLLGLDTSGQTNQTNGSGVAYGIYNWNSVLTANEVVSAATAGAVTDLGSFYWVVSAANDATLADQAASLWDGANSAVVANDGGVYKVWTWDANDAFKVYDGACSTATYAEFQAAVANASATDHIWIATYKTNPAQVSEFAYDC